MPTCYFFFCYFLYLKYIQYIIGELENSHFIWRGGFPYYIGLYNYRSLCFIKQNLFLASFNIRLGNDSFSRISSIEKFICKICMNVIYYSICEEYANLKSISIWTQCETALGAHHLLTLYFTSRFMSWCESYRLLVLYMFMEY